MEPDWVETAKRLGLSNDRGYIYFPEDGSSVTLDSGYTADDLRKIIGELERLRMNQQEHDLIHRMITDSGEMWRESQDRTQPNSEVVICRHPERALYLIWIGNVEGNINGWGVQVQPLHMGDAQEFFAAFGSHYYYWIGAALQYNEHRMRAYIKNGRKREWTVSAERCK